MKMAEKINHYEAIIIGTGQGGKPLAIDLGRAGWSTAVIEANFVGGSCINYGCTPTKTMITSAQVAYMARRAAEYGVNVSSVHINLERVIERKRSVVESFRSGGRKSLENTPNVELIFGVASFLGPHEVQVVKRDGSILILTSDRIFINTGTRPGIPDIHGLNSVPYFDSTTILDSSELPDHLIILGGGYVGVEFGQMFRRFGSRVTLIQRGKQLLSREDEDVAAEVARILEEDGIDIRLNSDVKSIEKKPDGKLKLTVKSETKEKGIQGSHLLVAVGRVPNTDDLNLEKAEIKTDPRGYIPVDERLETTVPGIFAIGDVKGGPAFTHISYDDYRVLRRNLLEDDHASVKNRQIPYTVFMDPQLGRVGLSEQQAREAGLSIRVAKMPMSHVARAIETGETRGFMKAVLDGRNQHILGCAILGQEGGELMSMIQIAMMGKIPYYTLRDAIFAHPTLAESLNNLFMILQ
jgi:pyruvate/2-oxoglutarate dehydrogenase complex dihydrolipoamide dehydrogenase (E3) component